MLVLELNFAAWFSWALTHWYLFVLSWYTVAAGWAFRMEATTWPLKLMLWITSPVIGPLVFILTIIAYREYKKEERQKAKEAVYHTEEERLTTNIALMMLGYSNLQMEIYMGILEQKSPELHGKVAKSWRQVSLKMAKEKEEREEAENDD